MPANQLSARDVWKAYWRLVRQVANSYAHLNNDIRAELVYMAVQDTQNVAVRFVSYLFASKLADAQSTEEKAQITVHYERLRVRLLTKLNYQTQVDVLCVQDPSRTPAQVKEGKDVLNKMRRAMWVGRTMGFHVMRLTEIRAAHESSQDAKEAETATRHRMLLASLRHTDMGQA